MVSTGRKRRPGRPKNPVARETLLALALGAFAERGYAGASMAEIAGSAGLRKASLFHHFSSKEALYLEVLAGIASGLATALADARLQGGDFGDRLDTLGTIATHYFGGHPGAAQLLLRELLDGGPFSSGPGAPAIQATLDSLAAFLQAGMLQGEIPYQDPHHLALSIASLHLTYYAAPKVCEDLLEAEVFEASMNEARLEAVLEQVRRLCGVAPA